MLVVGDVNSTIACALVAAKLGIPVAHVEAGLRSFDRTMPEEINRIVTDALSDCLFITEPSGDENLRGEGVPTERIYFVGNVMIDTLLAHPRASASRPACRHGCGLDGRRSTASSRCTGPSNVDDPRAARRARRARSRVARELPVVFPVHPRTRERLGRRAGLDVTRRAPHRPPLGYLDFLRLTAQARPSC